MFLVQFLIKLNVILLPILTSCEGDENIHEVEEYTDTAILEDNMEGDNEGGQDVSYDEGSSTVSYNIENTDNDSHSENIVVERFKFSVTPPKAMNLLATISPKKYKPQKEVIRIHQLSELGDSDKSSWSLNDEYEVKPPDYGEEYLHGDVEIEFNEENGKTESNIVTKIDIAAEKHPEVNYKGRLQNKLTTAKQLSVFMNKLKSKFEERGNTKQTSKPKKVATRPYWKRLMSTLNDERKFLTVKGLTTPENEYYVKSDRHVNRFVNLNDSVRVFPYPMYYSAQPPVVHQKKLVIPYPYFVLKSGEKDKNDQELEQVIRDNFNFVLTSTSNPTKDISEVAISGDDSDYRKLEVVINDEPMSELEPMKDSQVVDFPLSNDYGLLEDEDYVPSTKDYYDYYTVDDGSWSNQPGRTSSGVKSTTNVFPRGPSTRGPHEGPGSEYPGEGSSDEYTEEGYTDDPDYKSHTKYPQGGSGTMDPGRLLTKHPRRTTTKYPRGKSTTKSQSGSGKDTTNLPWDNLKTYDPFEGFNLENQTSTKYPNFYVNGSLYDYYDCKALSHGNSVSEHTILVVFIFTIPYRIVL